MSLCLFFALQKLTCSFGLLPLISPCIFSHLVDVVETPVKPIKALKQALPKPAPAKKQDVVQLVRDLLFNEELVRPVKIPIVIAPQITKRKVRRVKERKPTLPTKLIVPSTASILEDIERPKLIVKPPCILPPPPPPKKAPKVFLEPNYPVTTPLKKRLPQQPSKYVLQSAAYHNMAEPDILDHAPIPRVKALERSTMPIWTELFRRQAIRKAEEIVILPDTEIVPPRTAKHIRPHEPITIPQPSHSSGDWIDVTDFEMPFRSSRRRHLVMPADNTFEKQMRDFTLQLNAHIVKREEQQLRRQRVILDEENRRRQQESMESDFKHRIGPQRPKSLPPVPRHDLRIKEKTPDHPPIRNERIEKSIRVTPLQPSKMEEWSAEIQKQAARTLKGLSIPVSKSMMHSRKRAHAPSRFWMPSDEYTHVTDRQADRQQKASQNIPKLERGQPTKGVSDGRTSEDVDSMRLKMLKDDIEQNRRRRAVSKFNREQEMLMTESTDNDDDNMKLERHRRSNRMSMPPLPQRPFSRPISPIRQYSPSPVRMRRNTNVLSMSTRAGRGVSLPPQQDLIRGKHMPHLPLQPSKFWMPSGEYLHITNDKFKHISEDDELRTFPIEDKRQTKMLKLQQEFELDRKRRHEQRARDEAELETARKEDDLQNRWMEERQQRTKMRQLSMPPMPYKDIIRAENIPKASIDIASTTYSDYKPIYNPSDARRQEIEIERISKRINENIESYEESLKRRHHYAIPPRRIVSTPIHMKKKPKINWSSLYTNVTEKIEEKSDSEDDEWITLRRKRSKRHLVVPSAELTKTIMTESVPVPQVLVSSRRAPSTQTHSDYNVVEIKEMDVDHTRVPPPRPHYTEDAEFNSDWHAVAPHVRDCRGHVTPLGKAGDKQLLHHIRSYSTDKTAEGSVRGLNSTLANRATVSKRGVIKPKPLSLLLLDEKARHTKHLVVDREPEIVLSHRKRRSRHNLVVPGWEPGDTSIRMHDQQENIYRKPYTTSSPVDGGRRVTTKQDLTSVSVSPIRPMSLGRRASVSYLPRQTPTRDTGAGLVFRETSRCGSIDRGTNIKVKVSGFPQPVNITDAPEHHVHPMIDTFKTAVDKVRERLPWRSVYNEAERRTHHAAVGKWWLAN